jgi:hypothetical protein
MGARTRKQNPRRILEEDESSKKTNPRRGRILEVIKQGRTNPRGHQAEEDESSRSSSRRGRILEVIKQKRTNPRGQPWATTISDVPERKHQVRLHVKL